MNASPTFSAPWGTSLKVLTGVVLLLVLGACLAVYGSPVSAGQRFWLSLLPALAIPVGMAFMVCGYRLEKGFLVVVRPGWSTRLPLRDIRSIRPCADELGGSVRLMGNGGFFTFAGWFWNRRLGRYRLFLNDGRRAVLLDLGDRKVVVGPGEVEAFIAEARRIVTPT